MVDPKKLERFKRGGVKIPVGDDCAAFDTAAHLGSRFVLRQLARGANVNAFNDEGDTALTLNAWSGDAKAVRRLLEVGAADANALATDGSALALAAERGHVKCVELLISHGARLDHVDAAGNSALMLAAKAGKAAAVAALLDNGANLYLKNLNGEDALDMAVKEARASCAELLIDAMSDDE